MKLYRMGECEIRIRLTKEDLESFSVTAEELDYESVRGKKIIWELFDKARREIGFDTAGEKIYIQLYPTARGGCELFVTKLEQGKSRSCFSLSDFDTLFTALSLSALPMGAELWRDTRSDKFYAIVPEDAAPPVFYEFGEKIKIPSSIFFSSRCRKMRWGERQVYARKE